MIDIKDVLVSSHFVSANKWEYTAKYHKAGFKAATMSVSHNSRVIPEQDLYDLKQRLMGHVADNGLERDVWVEAHPNTSAGFDVF